MFRSLRIQLGAIVFGFVLLLAGSAAITYFTVQARAGDAALRALLLIQLGLLVAALALLAWGYFFTRRRFARPLDELNEAARRIASGQLDASIQAAGQDEFAELARAFDAMRAEVAASRSQLESRVAQRTREVTAAFELSQEIIAQIDPDRLLRSVAERARALTRADAASLCLLDPSETTLILSASSGNGSLPLTQRQPVWLFPASRAVGAGQTVVTETACTHCDFLRAHGPGQCIATPLRVGDHTLGELCVVRSAAHSFDADETRALTLLANSAAVAIANARLIEAERHQAEQAAAVAEREHLAADLHDHLAQTLGFLNLETDRVKTALAAGAAGEAHAKLDRMKTAIGEAYRQVRAALVGLREAPPPGDDLAEKLDECLADFRTASGLAADLVIADASALALPRVSQAQAVMIVREALINVRRHAQARRARVRVDRDNGHARFTIEDDGCGFAAAPVEGHNHLGLTIMQARAERCGGYLRVDSTPGRGTTVAAHFPIEPHDAGAA